MSFLGNNLLAEVLEHCGKRGLKIAVIESLTGGLLANRFVSVSGASDVFLGGVIAYQDELKSYFASVSPSLIQSQTAVDAEVASQMAAGIRSRFSSVMDIARESVIGISTTGVAGPDAVGEHPVGEVYIGISVWGGESVYQYQLQGDRQQIREQACDRAIEAFREQLGQ
jgi:PncC family amidohydrolase